MIIQMWVADIIAPAGTHILCIALSQKNLKITKVSYVFINKTRSSVLFLGFQYFELRNIYKRI